MAELIRASNLGEACADQLNPLVRMAYLECHDQKLEEDKYDREQGEKQTNRPVAPDGAGQQPAKCPKLSQRQRLCPSPTTPSNV